MYLKIFAVLVCMEVAYCQDHQHGHSFSLKTVVTHEVPKKLEYHHYEPEHISAPIQKQVIQEYHDIPEIHGNVLPPRSLVRPTIQNKEESFYQEAPERAFLTPHEPAPVYESVEPVRAPVQLKIVQQGAPHAPTHRVVQLVQQKPIKPSVIRVASVTPVTHPAPIIPIVPILHQAAIAPIIQQAPVQHPTVNVVQQVPVQHRIIPETHRAPIQQYVVEETLRAPIQQYVVQGSLRAPIQQHVVQETHRAPIQQYVVEETLRAPIQQHVVQESLRAPIQQQVVQETHRAPIQQYVVENIYRAPIQQHVVQETHRAPIQQHVAVVQATHRAPIQQHVVEVAHAPVPHHEETYNRETYNTESHKEESSDQESHHDHHHEIDYYAHPKYEFAYEVKDPHTHDEKYHHESRDGDVVNGVYSLHEPDGSVRTVKYSSDKKTGFNAEVSHKGHTEHIIPHHHQH